jgi:putative FmdB family regulatory protein
MPIYAYECQACEHQEDKILTIAEMEEDLQYCEECDCPLEHIITASGQYCGNNDAAWLRDATEVVDKDGGPAAREFVKNPTRSNRNAWMKETGCRPRESGEKTSRDPVNMEKAMDRVMRNHYDRVSSSEYRRYTAQRERDRANLKY